MAASAYLEAIKTAYSVLIAPSYSCLSVFTGLANAALTVS
jgi:hypothetical protein